MPSIPARLEAIEKATSDYGFGMASNRETGSLLKMLCASKLGGRFLELGTGTGLSACWMLDGMDHESTLLSIDNDPSVVAIAKRHLADPRVEFVVNDGLQAIEALSPGTFDLIFADAMPGKYERFDLTIRLLRPGAICVLDDMLPQPNWAEGHQSKVDNLMESIKTNRSLSYTFLSWSTGICLCTKCPDSVVDSR